MDSNCGYLALEATALLTEPQQLPNICVGLFKMFGFGVPDSNVLVAPLEFLDANNIPAKDSIKHNSFDAVDWVFTSGKSGLS